MWLGNIMEERCLCWPFTFELSSTLPTHGITIPLNSPAAEMPLEEFPEPWPKH